LKKVIGPASNDEEKAYLAENVRRLGLAYLAAGQVEKAAAETRRARDVLDTAWKKANHIPNFRIEAAACHATLAKLAVKPGSGIPAADAQTEADEAMRLLNTN